VLDRAMSVKKKPTGQPAAGQTRMNLYVSDELIAALDRWRGRQEIPPTRPEALRRLAAMALEQDRLGRGGKR
jgi:hypothetical protein